MGAMSGPPPYPGLSSGHPAYAEASAWASRRSQSGPGLVLVLALVLLVVTISLGEAVLALRAWNDCDVGVNASANFLSIVYLGLPLLLAGNGVAAVIVGWSTWRATRSALRRRFWILATPTLGLVLLAYVWWAVVVTPSSHPDPICPGNVPPWVPPWLPS